MGGGRKNLKRAVEEHTLALKRGQSIMQVVSLRDGRGEKSLALFPAKFQKSMWMKRGSFVVVDESGREEALESGSKVACIVSQVLFFEQVRQLQKSPEWPEVFKSTAVCSSTRHRLEPGSQQKWHETSSSDDDGLPPLEANQNRKKPFELHSDAESSDSHIVD